MKQILYINLLIKELPFFPWRRIYKHNEQNILSGNLKLTDVAGVGLTDTDRDSFQITGTVIHQSGKTTIN